MEVISEHKFKTVRHYGLVIKHNDLELNYYVETVEVNNECYIHLMSLRDRVRLKTSEKKRLMAFIQNYFKKVL